MNEEKEGKEDGKRKEVLEEKGKRGGGRFYAVKTRRGYRGGALRLRPTPS